MNRNTSFWRFFLPGLGLAAVIASSPAAAGNGELELAGSWESRRILGPMDQGSMLIRKSANGFLAEFGGHRVSVTVDETAIAFLLPDGGRFEGELEKNGNIRGHWIQPRSKFGGNGGQVAMLVPDLELCIAFNAGNYSDRVGFRIQNELIPKYILPAISE